MKKLKTVLAIIFSIIVVSILIYFLPTEGLATRIPFFNRFYTNTILEVITINGKANVKINGKEYGETPLTINELTPGEYTVELDRISDSETFYQKQTLTIKLTKNTTSRIEVEIGPAGILHGAILYYTSQNNLNKNEGSLSVLCDVENSKIYLDGEYVKQTPVIAKPMTAKEYQLEILADGYESLDIPVLIEDGYLLNVKTYLFPIPIIFDTTENVEG
jgi:hypothetical protein